MTDLVCVRTYELRAVAEMAAGLLAGNGIDARVFSDDVGGTNPAVLSSTGGARLMVRASDADDARDVLDSVEELALSDDLDVDSDGDE